MKINPIGIQSYQQTTQSNQRQATEFDSAKTTAETSKVAIPVQEESVSSKLAVKLPSENFGKYLSTEERQALDLLFSRFRDASRFGAAYSRDMESSDNPNLGQVVDLKA